MTLADHFVRSHWSHCQARLPAIWFRVGISSGSTIPARSRSSASARSHAAAGNGYGSWSGCFLPDVRHGGGVQGPAQDRGGERSHRRRLDLRVEPLVVGAEPFVVAAVAGLGGAVDRDHKAGAAIGTAADPAADLDVLRGRLGLADDGHQGEAVDVDTDLDDVRREADVDAAGTAVAAAGAARSPAGSRRCGAGRSAPWVTCGQRGLMPSRRRSPVR